MADFYAAPSLEFWVPNDQPFPADPGVVMTKMGYTPPIVHPVNPYLIEHPNNGAEIRHPSRQWQFSKTQTLSPFMQRQRNVAG